MTNMLTRLSDTERTYNSLVQQRIDTNRLRLTSQETKGEKYSELQNVSGFIHDESILEGIDKLNENNAFLRTIQDTALSQLTGIQKINDRFHKLVMDARNDTPVKNTNFQNDIRALLRELTGVLNDRFETRINTFAGTATDRDAVIDLEHLGGLAANAAVDTSYYQGNQNTLDIELDPRHSITLFEVNASHPAIEKLVRGLRIALSANPADSNDPCLTKALDLSTEIQNSDLISAFTTAGVPRTVIDLSTEAIQDLKTTTVEKLQKEGLTNYADTLMQLETDRAALQASQWLLLQASQDLQKFIDRIQES